MNKETVLISVCLLNIPCRYNGQPAEKCLDPVMLDRIPYQLVPVCPEQLAGLPTPRKPVEIRNGDGFDVLKGRAVVISKDGDDLTGQFIKGARITLEIARITKVAKMITQPRSPSCSSSGIYDGSFSHRLINGYGVCAALLKQNGIELIDVDTFESIMQCIQERATAFKTNGR